MSLFHQREIIIFLCFGLAVANLSLWIELLWKISLRKRKKSLQCVNKKKRKSILKMFGVKVILIGLFVTLAMFLMKQKHSGINKKAPVFGKFEKMNCYYNLSLVYVCLRIFIKTKKQTMKHCD